MIWLKQSTAGQEIPLGYFLDSTDGNTEETALTINNTDIKLWKTGATTLANKNSGGGTHISNGIYYATLDATDTNTLGPMVVFVHVAGALTVRLECIVLAANVYDSLVGGNDVLQTDVTQWNGSAVTSGAIPSAAAGANGGLPTVDANNRVAGIQGTKNDLDDLNDISTAQVNAQVDDVINTDTKAELSSVPAANASLGDKLAFLAMAQRNGGQSTSSQYRINKDDGSALGTAVQSDNGTTFSRGKLS